MFCSLVLPDNTLPASALTLDPFFYRLRVSAHEISAACADLGLKFNGTHISLPYRVVTIRLFVVAPMAAEEFRRFLHILNGAKTFRLFKYRNGYLVRADRGLCFALWRAMMVVPWDSQMLEVRMHSEVIERAPIQPDGLRISIKVPYSAFLRKNEHADSAQRHWGKKRKPLRPHGNTRWEWIPHGNTRWDWIPHDSTANALDYRMEFSVHMST
jgi:hypothetical protein